jgi:hypothetical protein
LARDLAIEENLWDGAADRIHVATALTVGATEFLSVDGRLAKRLKKSDVRGCKIVSPSDSTLLPESYRQHGLFQTPRKTKPKPKPKPKLPAGKADDFLSVARRLGADESKEHFEVKLKKIAKPKGGQ